MIADGPACPGAKDRRCSASRRARVEMTATKEGQMQQIRDAVHRPLAVAVIVGALTTLGLSACGGSSGSSSTTTHANAAALFKDRVKSGPTYSGAQSGSSTKAGASSARPRLSALRECLSKQGVQLPTRPGAGVGLFLGGANLPKGVSRAQLQAAMRKCLGGGFLARGGPAGRGPGARPAVSGRFRLALSAFAACLRANGVAVPKSNTPSGGPVFSTKGLDTASPQFKAATAKCRAVLVGALGVHGARPGAAGSTAQSPQPNRLTIR
jgi:hypothetical protein